MLRARYGRPRVVAARAWRADWGGLLAFFDEAGSVAEP